MVLKKAINSLTISTAPCGLVEQDSGFCDTLFGACLPPPLLPTKRDLTEQLAARVRGRLSDVPGRGACNGKLVIVSSPLVEPEICAQNCEMPRLVLLDVCEGARPLKLPVLRHSRPRAGRPLPPRQSFSTT